MTSEAILAAIDEEIHKLQQARAMLSDAPSSPAKKSVGRPKGSIVQKAPVAVPVKRVMSEEARAKIASAQKKRWAAAKKAAK